jgi:hypothetical protein
LLARFAIVSLLSTALSRQLLESHKLSGVSQTKQGFVQLLNAFIATNAVAASVQLCGAMLLTGVLLAKKSTGVNLRQSVLLVCSLSLLASPFLILAGLRFHPVAVLSPFLPS